MARTKKGDYTVDQLKRLSDRDHVRKRTNVYLGTMEPTTFNVPIFSNTNFSIKEFTFIPAVYKAIGEIIDNGLDEFAQIKQLNKTLTIEALPQDGWYSIADNGRGIPIDPFPDDPTIYGPEVVLGELRSGRNFDDDNREAGVIGVNGVGAACTNFCSTEFKVDIERDKKKYTQKFTDGALKRTAARITRTGKVNTGTKVSFQLDDSVFGSIRLDEELMRNRAMEIAFNCPDLTVRYNKEKFKFKKGFDDVIKTFSQQYHKFSTKTMEWYVVFDAYVGADEAVFTWVNNSFLFDGGICNTQFTNAFYDAVGSHLERDAKKLKCQINKDDIRQNLLVFGFLKLADARYDSQAKTRLTGPNLRKEFVQLIEQDWSAFARKHKSWLEQVLQHANERYHAKADKEAQKEHEQKKRKKIDGLLDATSDVRSQCQLFIFEGDSAKSSLVEVRDPSTMASYPLGGKINNVYGKTVAQVLQMGKLTDILAAIGLTPGKKAFRNSLRYGKIIIATDADYDGADIFATLICLFHYFWPELFDSRETPFFYRLVTPNVVVSKGNKRVHFPDRPSFEASKEKYKGWTAEYMKGLGSLLKEDWETIVTNVDSILIPIVDIDGQMDDTLKLLFSDDMTDLRKQWLSSNE